MLKDTSSIDTIKQWVELYSQELYSWTLYKTSNKESSEDIVQETFIAAFQAIDRFEEKSNPKTWLFSILNNKITDYHRKKFRNPVITESKIYGEGKSVIGNMFDENEDWKHRPKEWETTDENLIDNAEFNKILQGCMEKLPDNWSSAIQLKYLEEKEGKEICQDLGITPSNFWQILHRAKLQLRQCLELHWFKK